ncbi:hypothetical protein [Sphingobium boeckii]|uniref:ABC-type Fe3+-hydroxamate transport system substrate-binding protein n=1 Tax=Sphingobium boeckii TaxID=1082345 RepID=A0A7W9AJ69_9SPHN|nr:hypothetical protein [Sphingobium boeckii]MBB5686461.1 ABC-type Fe3+-hydroxamate transport system substrate-binding protein [Sphingobium boeckii]
MMKSAPEVVLESMEKLSRALGGRDCSAIETAVTEVAAAVDAVRGVGAWRATPELRATLKKALAVAESARMQANVMSDAADRQLEALAALRPGHVAALAYDRNGQQRQAPYKQLS